MAVTPETASLGGALRGADARRRRRGHRVGARAARHARPDLVRRRLPRPGGRSRASASRRCCQEFARRARPAPSSTRRRAGSPGRSTRSPAGSRRCRAAARPTTSCWSRAARSRRSSSSASRSSIRGDLVVVEGADVPRRDHGVPRASRPSSSRCRSTSDGLDVDELERRLAGGLRPKLLYTIPDHQNPAGVSLSAERREPLVELARRYGFLIVEDVAYRELGFDGDALPSLWSLAPDVVVQAGTTSKTFFPGVRLGWAAGPAEVVAQLVSAKQNTDQCAGALGQRLFEEYVRRGWIDEQLALSRALYRRKCERLLAALERSMPDGRALDAAARRLLLLADAPGGVDAADARAPRGRARRRHRPRHRSSTRTAAAPTRSASRSASSTRRRSTTASSGSRRSALSEPARRHYRWDDMPKEALKPDLAPAADLDRADDARARVPREGLHRPEALARERAAHLHPRGRASGSGSARTSPRSSTSPPARCCISRRTSRTRPRRSRTRSTSTSSARRGQDWLDGSDAYLRDATR